MLLIKINEKTEGRHEKALTGWPGKLLSTDFISVNIYLQVPDCTTWSLLDASIRAPRLLCSEQLFCTLHTPTISSHLPGFLQDGIGALCLHLLKLMSSTKWTLPKASTAHSPQSLWCPPSGSMLARASLPRAEGTYVWAMGHVRARSLQRKKEAPSRWPQISLCSQLSSQLFFWFIHLTDILGFGNTSLNQSDKFNSLILELGNQ